jgi:hypothetical protein
VRRQVLQVIGREDIVRGRDPKVVSFPNDPDLGLM